MALSATFVTDFSDFYTAVQKAEVELKTLGYGAEGVGRSLNRMVDQFSGRKVIQDATVMTEAIERIGGVGKLTEAELSRVSAKAQEATAKMRAMGVEVPANLQEIADAAKPVTTNLGAASKATDLLTGAFGQLTAAFTVGNLISKAVGTLTEWTTAAIASASELVNLSQKTGFSIEGVQRLSHVANESGTSLDAFGDAALKLGVRLAGGSGSVRDAVKSLGLEFQALKALAPEQQFEAVMVALEAIEDPQERNRLALELFGTKAAAILPAIAAGYKGLAAAATVSSADQVKALADTEQAWQTWKQRRQTDIRSFLGNLVLASDGMRGLTDEQRKQAQALIDAGMQYDAAVAKVRTMRGDIQLTSERTAESTRVTKNYADQIRDVETKLGRLTDAQRAELEAAQRLGKSTEELEDKFGLTAAELRIYAEQQRQATQTTKAQQKATEDAATAQVKLNKEARDYNNWLVQREFDQVERQMQADAAATAEAAKQTEAFNRMLFYNGNQLETQTDLMRASEAQMVKWGAQAGILAGMEPVPLEPFDQSATSKYFAGFGDFLSQQMPSVILKAIQGGGNITSSIGSAVGGFFTQAGGAIEKTATKALSGAFGKSIGGALGSLVPAAGALLGPALEGITTQIGKLFGRDEESKVVNPLRDQFIAAAGGLHQLNMAAHDAGMTLDQLLKADKETEFKAAVDQLTGAFQFQDAAMATLTETARRYGFTLEELGPAFQRQELDKQAQQLFKDWEVLNAAGIDTVAITDRMGESVSAYVNQAIAMGSEVPDAMRPMLQSMVDMGQLTDAQGNKIESLEDSGISFSMTMSQGFKALIDSVGKLTDAIGRGLGLAVAQTSDSIKKMPRQVGVDVVYRDPGYKTTHDVHVTYSGAGEPMEGYQHGTNGFRNFGAGTPVMLHGWEAVVPMDESSAGSGGVGGGVGGTTVNVDARGAFFSTPGDEQRLALVIEQALNARHGLSHYRYAG
jgi:hypothetical protein